MKIFVSAAEISSDIHAEKILKAIQEQLQKSGHGVEWRGIGGPKVRALPGFHAIEPAENMRTMGFLEVFKKISYFKKLIQKTCASIQEFNPDLILTFDYPDFHFRVMNRVLSEHLAPKALRICGIPPKVWVWRSHRVEKIRKYYHGVWVIFPFEKKFYEQHKIPVIFEGNPLIEDLLKTPSTEKQNPEVITVMPGSRDAELKYHLPIIPKALELYAKKIEKKVIAQVPIPSGVNLEQVKQSLVPSALVDYRYLQDGSTRSLAETQFGLIKSGTSTLEAAVLGCVPVIYYRMSFISEWIMRLFVLNSRVYPGPVGLPNILLGVKKRAESYFPELLGSEATAEKISDQLAKLYQNQNERVEKLHRCREVKELFYLNQSNGTCASRSAERMIQWKNQLL